MVEVDKVSPVGAQALSLLADKEPSLLSHAPAPTLVNTNLWTGRRGRGETRFAIPFPAMMLCAGLSLARKQPRRE